MSRKLTRTDVANFLNDPKLTLEKKHEIIRDKLKITSIEVTLDGEPLVDAVFAAYESALAEVESKRAAKKVAAATAPSTVAEAKEEGGGESRKAVITNVILEAKKITIAALIADIDQRCGYAASGKTSRTRVSRVVKDLTGAGKIEVHEGTITVK